LLPVVASARVADLDNSNEVAGVASDVKTNPEVPVTFHRSKNYRHEGFKCNIL